MVVVLGDEEGGGKVGWKGKHRKEGPWNAEKDIEGTSVGVIKVSEGNELHDLKKKKERKYVTEVYKLIKTITYIKELK